MPRVCFLSKKKEWGEWLWRVPLSGVDCRYEHHERAVGVAKTRLPGPNAVGNAGTCTVPCSL
ncbi:hypothetical protein TPADAL_0637a [Treponema pallidum subsp. pallidum DAL-1]|uniref:Uncharacterized protein n=2 Tax=Treponema pallidum TaxID=160 RepID=A0AAU8RXM2_TREPL|nr:hypothetical protein TPESAMD_0637a [Treponema pallidum subsp. pertenue str. SamoaD]AEZ58830.1 hypothetical protein TPECDC2_0637a [Treponema pallidum subsp. pertenue str. CDC2]AEZ59898.1 hypothetical protein TPEGAU_0637a [Treponema pallidum subsp. pertenue str. Gauthier]AEZ60958.1 hypothetical protein TPADAL_0637a [Treponema pallidum subsp. pallidum DAL-1]AGK84282.1 hypothetical protein TPFB_0637a [Treponema pallidum str. Fribourg-Blanc]AJB40658.1 hypothetical protein TENDBA_0637a [Treponema